MKVLGTVGVIALIHVCAVGQGVSAATITVRNPSDQSWPEAPVVVPATAFLEVAAQGELAVKSGDELLPVQRDDLDGDGRTDELAFLVKLEAGQAKTFSLIPRPAGLKVTRRAHALMSLKGFDGPGWESDVMAYRIYWNADNATDIFGKSQPILSLDHWATPGVPHSLEDKYGIDVLKVGRSFGIGGFAGWINGRIEKVSNVMKTHYIRSDGPIRAVVELEYVNWQPGPFADLSRQAITSTKVPHYDLTVRMSIFAGQRWAEADVQIKSRGSASVFELVTGLPKHEETTLISDKVAGILGRWGRQALGDREVPKAGDLGMGVIVDPAKVVDYGEDEFNSYVRLKAENGRVRYRYHGSWFKEPGAAKSAQEYEAMLRSVAKLRPEVTVH